MTSVYVTDVVENGLFYIVNNNDNNTLYSCVCNRCGGERAGGSGGSFCKCVCVCVCVLCVCVCGGSGGSFCKCSQSFQTCCNCVANVFLTFCKCLQSFQLQTSQKLRLITCVCMYIYIKLRLITFVCVCD